MFAALEATWPPLSEITVADWRIRHGDGGGKRVSAATALSAAACGTIDRACRVMRADARKPIFRLSPEQVVLDDLLAQRGFSLVDPSVMLAAPAKDLVDLRIRPLDAVPSPVRLGIHHQLWSQAGMPPARHRVMDRVRGPKAWLLGRMDDRAAGVGFVAVSKGIAFLHAVEVRPKYRRRGVARALIHRAARFALSVEAEWIALAVTEANDGARSLYRGLGMKDVCRYHYRVEDAPCG